MSTKSDGTFNLHRRLKFVGALKQRFAVLVSNSDYGRSVLCAAVVYLSKCRAVTREFPDEVCNAVIRVGSQRRDFCGGHEFAEFIGIYAPLISLSVARNVVEYLTKGLRESWGCLPESDTSSKFNSDSDTIAVFSTSTPSTASLKLQDSFSYSNEAGPANLAESRILLIQSHVFWSLILLTKVRLSREEEVSAQVAEALKILFSASRWQTFLTGQNFTRLKVPT